MTQPLSLEIKLSGNPKQQPQFAELAKLKDGTQLHCADPKATRAMIALMDMEAVLGGAASHYGGPAAFAEIMSAAHAYMFYVAEKKQQTWYRLFNFINDAGHCENGLYALKANYNFANLKIEDLKKFRSIESVLTGHGESHLFPQGVYMSNGPLGSAFPQSQGLAMADSMAGLSRLTLTAISDGACMEGEAREALAAIPGFAQKGMMAPYVLMISDNNTKLSGRIDQESFSMAPSFKSLVSLGWHVIELKDAHNLQACLLAVEEACELAMQNPKVPVAIHAHTIKGIGTKKTAESSSGAHGFPLKSATELHAFIHEIYDGQAVPVEFMTWIEAVIQRENQIKSLAKKSSAPEEKIQTGIAKAMITCRKKNLPVVSVASDLAGSTGTAGFRKEFPQDSIDVGVAESNMISVGAGFSKQGFIPVVDTFAQFGVTKGALPLTMAALSQSPMICVFSHTGFQDAADGASHQALTYISMLASIPHVRLYVLSCSAEAEALMTQAIEKFAADRQAGREPETSVFFLGRENFPPRFGEVTYQLGKSQIVLDTCAGQTRSVTLVAAGSLVGEALRAAKELKEKGVGCVVLNPSIVNKPDLETLKLALGKTQGQVITIEDHQLIAGMGAIMSHALALENVPFKMKSLGVREQFGRSAYNAIELYQAHGLDAQAIVRAAMM